MAGQQSRRRRKKYQPGSAYAGDIRPKGIFAVFGNVRLFFIIGVLIMGGSLLVGGILRSGALTGNSSSSSNNFVTPPKDTPSGTVVPTVQFKQYTSAPGMTIDPTKTYTATIKTSAGDIQVELLAADVPQTVNNFIFLAKDGFYNDLSFFYVNQNDVQAGDPTCSSDQSISCRQTGDPGYELSQEKPGGTYAPGTLGMVNASQFFIALTGNQPSFQNYTPFGRVTSGLDVAQKLTQGAAIQSITVQEK